MGHVQKWRKAGERAAASGEDVKSCPYHLGHSAWKHWHHGWREEIDRMEEWMRDMEELQKRERS